MKKIGLLLGGLAFFSFSFSESEKELGQEMMRQMMQQIWTQAMEAKEVYRTESREEMLSNLSHISK